MKLRILHTEASSGWGGQEIRILTESQVFIKNGHEVMVAADIDSQLAKKASSFHVPLHAIALKKKNIKSLLALRSLINELQPDVISCHSSTDHWLSAIARLSVKQPPAIVRTRHISAPVTRNFPTKWLYNQGTDALMTTGIGIREALIKDDFVKADTISSVPTGIDTERHQVGNLQERRQELMLPSNHYIFGIVAALRSWKGHVYLIEAFGKLNNSETSLLIVGDGGQMSAYRALAESVPNTKNIHFVGNQSDVIPYLQAMDCFVLPSYANEGVPQALLQAMAVGLPIISCPVGGIPECLEGFSNSTLVEPKNSEALKNAMENQWLQEKTHRLPRQRHTPFDLNRLYDSSLKVYEKALRK